MLIVSSDNIGFRGEFLDQTRKRDDGEYLEQQDSSLTSIALFFRPPAISVPPCVLCRVRNVSPLRMVCRTSASKQICRRRGKICTVLPRCYPKQP